MRKYAMLAVALALAAAASSPAEDKKLAGDLAALQGKWKVWLTSEKDYIVVEVKGSALTLTRYHSREGSEPSTYTESITLDEKADPKRLTRSDRKSPKFGFKFPDERCIYELHGDTWLIYGDGPDTWPKHFYSGPADNAAPRTLVLKREKTQK